MLICGVGTMANLTILLSPASANCIASTSGTSGRGGNILDGTCIIGKSRSCLWKNSSGGYSAGVRTAEGGLSGDMLHSVQCGTMMDRAGLVQRRIYITTIAMLIRNTKNRQRSATDHPTEGISCTRVQICAVCRYRARCGYEGERELCQARERDVREEEK